MRSRISRSTESPVRSRIAPAVVHEALRSPGRPLDTSTRALFNARFGHDFSGVRVHADARAAESADAIDANAYTVGRDIVFGRDQYAPETIAGRRLLAHELTHTVQQEHSPIPRRLTIDDAHEGGANRSGAAAVMPQRKDEGKAPAADPKKKEIRLVPAARTIPLDELKKPPAGLPRAALPSKKPETAAKTVESEPPDIETSVQGSLADKKITTNIEVAIPVGDLASWDIFGQPLVLGKDLKAELEIGPPQSTAFPLQQDLAVKASLKALWYELEGLKPRLKSRFGEPDDLGLGILSEMKLDPRNLGQPPEFSLTGGAEASYRLGHTPIFLQGKIGYKITFPPSGPMKAEPAFDFGFKINL